MFLPRVPSQTPYNLTSAMPSRRTHTKSRNGCDTCRQRRIKCDESGVPCGKCAARQLHCQYTRRDNGFITLSVPPPLVTVARADNTVPPCPKADPQPTSATESSGRSPACSYSSGLSTSATSLDQDCPKPTSHRLKELELMRQWCMHSCRTLHRPESLDQKMWLGFVTDLGLKHGFLMDIILALSATHIAAEATNNRTRATYTSLALEYQNSGVGAARDELLHVNEDNCHALFSFTILNIPTSVVLAQLPTGGQDTAKSPLESIVISSEWISCLVSLMSAGERWLRHGPFRDAYDKCDDPDSYDDAMRPSMQRLTGILARSKYAGRGYSDEWRMFSHAVELLEERFIRSKSMSIAWPAEIDEAFIVHLQNGNKMALMITMHWGVLLHRLGMWWASFTGKRLVEQISRGLNAELAELECPDAKEAVQWARIEVGLDIEKTWT